MKSLQNKVFFFFVSLLLLLQSIIFISNYRATLSEESRQLDTLLTSAEQNFKNQFEHRSYDLAAFSETAAKDFALKQVFEEDTRSLLVALNNHRKRIDADMVIAVKANGTVVAQLINRLTESNKWKVKVGSEQGQAFGFMQWFELDNDSHLYQLEGDIYQLNFSPIKSGALVIGWVGFGYAIDERLANRFSALTGLTTNFIIKENKENLRLFASSKNDNAKNNSSIAEQQLTKNIINQQANENVIATVYPLGVANEQEIFAVMYGERSDLLLSLQDRWQELLLFAAFLLLTSLVGAYWIAASISRPVKLLVEQVKAITHGNYAQTLSFSSKDELGQLATEFNQMKSAINQREKTISHQAFHERLTGLPNRYQLIAVLKNWLKSPPESFAVLRISPQRMKEVNYTLGHDVGDSVVKEIANRLGNSSENEFIFHIGGSSFALLVKDTNQKQLSAFMTEIEQTMEGEFRVNNTLLNIQVKIGASLYPDHSSQPEQLLTMAGTALQHAQKNSLQHMFYQTSLSLLTVERLHLINGLKSAIYEEQLVLYYQPKLDLKSGLVSSVEALVRWVHPELGMVPPDKFISLAEQTGYIHPLTAWVIDTALAQYSTWQKRDIHLPIAINVSAENLKLPNFYELVISALDKHNLTPDAICIEITESVVVDDPIATIDLLSRFEKRGFKLSIDDYGTGYSSLAQLTQLPICEMKIDKAFVTDLVKNKQDRVIVKSTIELAHALNLGVVAEGIEDEATLDWLRDNGCEKAQGYFISKPKPANEFDPWLLASKYFKAPIEAIQK